MKTLPMPLRMGQILLDYRRQRPVVHSMPIRLWVESASCCNLRCVMCPNKDMEPSEKGLMKLELFQKIVDEASGFARDLYLHHRGEPLLNPALFEMIAYARRAGLNTRFHTNGTLMDADKAARLVAAAPNLVSVSIDGFEKKAYEKIRVGADFETTVENVCRLARLKREQGAQLPYLVVEKIRFRNPECPENPDAVDRLRQRFLAAGVDEVIEKEEYVWAEADAPELQARRTSSVCTFPWYAMVICCDGTVTPCPQDFWADMKMGDASQQSLAAIWNGEPYRKLRGAFGRKLESLPLCRKCDRLTRKTLGGIPFQYLATFLVDQFVGYNRRLRRFFGTSERNT